MANTDIIFKYLIERLEADFKTELEDYINESAGDSDDWVHTDDVKQVYHESR